MSSTGQLSTLPFWNRRKLLKPIKLFFVVFITIVVAFFISNLSLPKPKKQYSVAIAEFIGMDKFPIKSVILPHTWDTKTPTGGLGVYTFKYNATTPSNYDPLMLYVPRYNQSLRAQFNGRLLSSVNSDEATLPGDNKPILYEIPRDLIQIGANSIVLTLTVAGPFQGFISEVYVGPRSELNFSHYFHLFMFARLTQLLIAGQFFIFLFCVSVYLRGRHRLDYFYLSLIFFFSIASYISMLGFRALGNINLSEISVGFGSFTVGSYLLFIISQCRYKFSYFHLLAYIPGIIFIIAMNSIPPSEIRASIFAVTILGFFGFCTLASLLFLIKEILIHKDSSNLWLLILNSSMFAFWAYDILMLLGYIENDAIIRTRFGYPLSIIVVGAWLSIRHASTLQSLENSEATLIKKLQELKINLNRMFENEKKLLSEKVILKERQRVVRDLHDGLGKHLIAISMLGKSNSHSANIQISDYASLALRDMRTVISAMENNTTELVLHLTDWKERTKKQLRVNSINLEFSVTPDDGELFNETIRPQHILQILRILDEVTLNSQRHSNCTLVSVNVTILPDTEEEWCALIEVKDDGIGFDRNLTFGLGLKNVEFRSNKIGALLHVNTSALGTSTKVLLPRIFLDDL